MPTYIDIEAVKLMFNTSYRFSSLRGDEIAKILEIRFGQESHKKPITDARNGKSSGLLQDGLPED
jgi:hypothetical protein